MKVYSKKGQKDLRKHELSNEMTPLEKHTIEVVSFL